MSRSPKGGPRDPERRASGRRHPDVLPPRVEVPRERQDWLRRPRLLRQLDGVLEAGVGKVIAGAGYGKTTTIASWVAGIRHSVDVAWLELRPDHMDPALLAEHLGLALRTVLPEVRGSVHTVLSQLSYAAIDRERPILLVLDDVHTISDSAAIQGLAALMEARPAGLLVVLSSRAELPGPWARLRERLEIVELGAPDLAFDRLETRQLLERLLPTGIDRADLDELYHRTEGWAAAVCLTSYALGQVSRSGTRLSAAEAVRRHTHDYLDIEVFGDLDPQQLRFLERASVVEVIDAEVGELLTGRGDSSDVLADLVRQNCLVEMSSDEPRRYRLHPALRERMLERLRAADVAEFRALHEAASRWYEERDLVDAAIGLAVAGGDTARAIELIRGASGWHIKHGYVATVARWLDALPASTMADDLALLLLKGRVSALVGDLDGAARELDTARRAIDRDPGPSPGERFALRHLEAALDFWTGAISSARRKGERIAADHDSASDDDVLEMFGLDRETMDLGLALVRLFDGATTETLELVRPYARSSSRRPTRQEILAFGLEATALAMEGYAEEARGTIERGRRALQDYDAPSSEPFAIHAAAAWVPDVPSASLSLEQAAWIAGRTQVPAIRAWVDLAVLRLALRETPGPLARTAAVNARTSVDALREPGFLGVLLGSLLTELDELEPEDSEVSLSPAEVDVLRVIAKGVTRAEAAEELHLSINTVKTHLRSAYRKLGSERREEALARATALGLIEDQDGIRDPRWSSLAEQR